MARSSSSAACQVGERLMRVTDASLVSGLVVLSMWGWFCRFDCW